MTSLRDNYFDSDVTAEEWEEQLNWAANDSVVVKADETDGVILVVENQDFCSLVIEKNDDTWSVNPDAAEYMEGDDLETYTFDTYKEAIAAAEDYAKSRRDWWVNSWLPSNYTNPRENDEL